MPVTIQPVSHAARKASTYSAVVSADALLQGSCPAEHKRSKSIIQSSFAGFSTQPPILSSSNGFVRAAMSAYCSHHHLTIRPEDIWFAILTQLSFFVNAHAEELRSFFVSHADRKELVIIDWGTIESADFGAMAERMTKLMAKSLNDQDLLPWIMPDFSTTKDTDTVVASILMMGAMQKYFSYTFQLACGIPSVTLLGERADWEEILQRLEKLPNLGAEPGQFYHLLKPVLTYFVASFDSAIAPSTIDFWKNIAHKSGGSGPQYLSGWITAFCFWDENGKSLYAPQGTGPSAPVESRRRGASSGGCDLDGTLYHRVNTNNIPGGFTSVPVKVDDNCHVHDTIMVAGSVGIQVTSSGKLLDEQPYYSTRSNAPAPPSGEPGPDSLQPVSGWWMYEKVDRKEGNAGETAALSLDEAQYLDAKMTGSNNTEEPNSRLKATRARKKATAAA
jgi:Domain of unknown function (DUF4419)